MMVVAGRSVGRSADSPFRRRRRYRAAAAYPFGGRGTADERRAGVSTQSWLVGRRRVYRVASSVT